MNEKDFIKSINKSYGLASDLDIAQSFSSPHSLSVNDEFRDVILNNESTYEEVYLKALELKFYNFILNDFSFFQFSRSSETNYRYAYYPNPYSPISTEWKHYLIEGLIDEEEYMHMLSSQKIDIRIPVIRYEYSIDQYRELIHPCSHLHVGFDRLNRWPVSKLLTPLSFATIIFSLYYSNEWKVHDDDSHDFKNKFTGLLATEKNICNNLPSALFSDKEKKIFFID